MLGSIVFCLASPTAHKKKFGWKKILVGKIFWLEKFFGEKISFFHFSENKKLLKISQLPRNHVSSWGGPAMNNQMDRWTDGWHNRVTSRVIPCSSKARPKNKQYTEQFWQKDGHPIGDCQNLSTMWQTEFPFLFSHVSHYSRCSPKGWIVQVFDLCRSFSHCGTWIVWDVGKTSLNLAGTTVLEFQTQWQC